jgi:prepilin-type N-terminal cleavage/methylation domain-containing protein
LPFPKGVRKERNPRQSGFTLIELVVVGAVLVVLAGFIVPAFQQQIPRWRLLRSANQVASVFQRARLEAVRRNIPAEVAIVGNQAVATVGVPADPGYITFNTVLVGGVRFEAPPTQAIVDGFGAADKAVFTITGTVEEAGAFRLAGQRNLFLEVRVAPPSTARVQIRKWDGTSFKAQGEGGQSWQW